MMTEMKLPACYAVIDENEMTYLDGGATIADSDAYKAFLNVGQVFNQLARIFSGASSIINNINVIYKSIVELNNLLGGPGMNSRLNVSLRERRGLVYNVEANLTSYTDTGVFCIYFGTDPEDADRCIGLVHKELKKLRDSKLSSSQLSAAKKQIIGQIGVAGDNFENNALDMGKTFLHYGKFEGSEEVFKRIEMLTAEHLWDIANEMFDENYLSTLIYL